MRRLWEEFQSKVRWSVDPPAYPSPSTNDAHNRDTLKRHETSHRGESSGSQIHSVRACLACAKARAKCSRQDPCQRCCEKVLACLYSTNSTAHQVTNAVGMESSEGSHGSNMETDGTAAQPIMQLPSDIVDEQNEASSIPVNWLPFDDISWDLDFSMVHMLDDAHTAIPAEYGDDQTSINMPGVDAHSLVVREEEHTISKTPGARSLQDSPDSRATVSTRSIRRHGSLYVDGQGSRYSRQRSPPESLSMTGASNDDAGENYGISTMDELLGTSKERWYSASDDVYSDIVKRFRNLCLKPGLLAPAFSGNSFPSKEALDACVELYFAHFHAIFPILHKPTFRLGYTAWITVLASAAVGCLFSHSIQRRSQDVRGLAEFLRRALQVESMSVHKIEPYNVAQAAFLNCVLENFQMDPKDSERAVPPVVALGNACPSHSWLAPEKLPIHATDRPVNWTKWVQEESQKRVAFAFWLLDEHVSYRSDQRRGGHIPLDEIESSIPCMEILWEADSEAEWTKLLKSSPLPRPLPVILKELYTMNCDPATFNDFICTILIYALCQKTQEVGKSIKSVFWNIAPNLGEGDDYADEATRTVWLPSNASYEKWRNSALDCLDTLHWHAHAIEAQNLGLESSVMLPLHLARLFLLTPIRKSPH